VSRGIKHKAPRTIVGQASGAHRAGTTRAPPRAPRPEHPLQSQAGPGRRSRPPHLVERQQISDAPRAHDRPAHKVAPRPVAPVQRGDRIAGNGVDASVKGRGERERMLLQGRSGQGENATHARNHRLNTHMACRTQHMARNQSPMRCILEAILPTRPPINSRVCARAHHLTRTSTYTGTRTSPTHTNTPGAAVLHPLVV
jgi:hypothetical protein